MNFDFNVITVIIALAAICGLVIVYRKYKEAKANDGKVDGVEILGILMTVNNEVGKVLNMMDDAKDVVTLEQKRAFVARNLEAMIQDTPLLDADEKAILKGFGMDNVARLIVKEKKVIAPDKLEPAKVEEPTK